MQRWAERAQRHRGAERDPNVQRWAERQTEREKEEISHLDYFGIQANISRSEHYLLALYFSTFNHFPTTYEKWSESG